MFMDELSTKAKWLICVSMSTQPGHSKTEPCLANCKNSYALGTDRIEWQITKMITVNQ